MAYSFSALYNDNAVELRVSGTSKGETVRFVLWENWGNNITVYEETFTANGRHVYSESIEGLTLHAYYKALAFLDGSLLGEIDVYLYQAPTLELVSYTDTTAQIKVSNIDTEADILIFDSDSTEEADEYTITSSSRTYTYRNVDMTEEREFYIYVSDSDYEYMMCSTLYYEPSNTYTIYFDKQGGSGGDDSVRVTYGQKLPSIRVPTREGYTFDGYYTLPQGGGLGSTYDSSGNSSQIFYGDEDLTLYANWIVGIELWDWDLSNGDATAQETQKAYRAITNQGPTSGFSYKVWNDMCAKVKEYLDFAGYSWSSYYANYSNTQMTTNDKTLTAKRFNSLRQNIGSHLSTGINEVSTGDTVYGSYFITIMEVLNQLIGGLK